MKRLLSILLALSISVAAFGQAAPASAEHATAETKQLAALEKSYFSTKTAYGKAKNSDTKHKFVVATVKFGTASMTAASLPARIKYRRALRLYREALKLDPKNKEALNNKKMIEDIYKSMGRPIPD